MINTIVKRIIIGAAIAVALVIVVGTISLVIMFMKPGNSKQRAEEARRRS